MNWRGVQYVLGFWFSLLFLGQRNLHHELRSENISDEEPWSSENVAESVRRWQECLICVSRVGRHYVLLGCGAARCVGLVYGNGSSPCEIITACIVEGQIIVGLGWILLAWLFHMLEGQKRGVDHCQKYCTRNIFLYGILWNTSGILGMYSTIFPKFDPIWDNICQRDHIFSNFEELPWKFPCEEYIVSSPPTC